MKEITDYLYTVPAEKQASFNKLRNIILTNLPNGFKESFCYGMISLVVPHSIYPNGYHCNPKLPLQFIAIASQKNFIALYHMGIYADSNLLSWFQNEYPKHCTSKLDMGKSCIRFKKLEEIPFDLIAELIQKVTVENWILIYENILLKK